MRLCVLISGNGSNLQAIIDAIQNGTLAAEIALVVSNRKAAYGLERAKQAQLPSLYFPLKPYGEGRRTQYDLDLARAIQEQAQPDLIVLAGWMHILSSAFLAQFPRQVINLHPALPNMFPGANAIQRAYEAYQAGEISHSGCMVHYAVPEVDAGQVIAQKVVALQPDDTLASFSAKMQAAEHQLIVEALQHFTL